MSERYHEAIEELRFLANEIRSRASDVSYGYFHGGDPRHFSPDPECSTDAEQEAHRLACAEWNNGNQVATPPVHEPFVSDDGKVYGHVTRATFGMGTMHYEDEDMVDWADRIYRALDQLEET